MSEPITLGEPPYRMNIPADLAYIAQVREWLGEVGRSVALPDRRVFDLQVAASEAVANGIEHALSEVEIIAWVLPDRLLVEITNDGVFSPGLYKDKEGRRRGLGLPLMVSLADHVHVSRLEGERTKVSLTFFTDKRAQRAPQPSNDLADAAQPHRFSRSPLLAGLLFLPAVLLIILVAVFYAIGLTARQDSIPTLTALNTLFIVSAALVVAYLAARTYLVSGLRSQLLLGSGAVLLAFGSLLAGPMLTDPNDGVTVHNTLFLVSGVLFAVSAVLLLRSKPRSEAHPARSRLVMAYGAALAFVVVWVLLVILDLLPDFRTTAGYTTLRIVVLALGVVAFIVACLLLLAVYRRRPSLFALFVAASFAMLAASMGALLVTEALSGTPITWVARSGQWLAGMYLLAGALSTQIGGVGLLPIERDLRESELRYGGLIDVNPDAVWIRSEGRFVFANAAAAKLLGYASPEELVGRDVDESFHPSTQQLQRQRVAQVYAGDISPAAEETFVRSDGSPVDVSIFRTRVEYHGRLAIQAVARDITAEKRAEETLRESEERYRGIVETAEEGIALHAADGTITYLNQRMAEMLGYSPEEMIGRNSLDFVEDDEKEKVIRLRRSVEEQGRFNTERKLRRKDGSVLWTLANVTRRCSADGTFLGYLAMHTDITQRKQAEMELQKGEERLRLAEASAQVGSWEWDVPSGRVVWTKELERIYGFRDGDFPGTYDSFRERIHAEDLERMEQQRDEAVAAHRPFDMDFRINTITGEPRWVSAKGRAIYNEAGKPERIYGVNLDITERKRAEEALARSEERFRSLVSVTADALYTMSPDWAVMTQLSGGAFLADTDHPNPNWLDEYIPSEDQEAVLSVINEAIRKKDVFQLEHRVRLADGTVGWTFSRAVPLLDEQGEIREWFGSATDVTERRSAEQELRESEQLFATAFTANPSALAIVSKAGPIIRVNPAFEELTGYTSEEAVGHSSPELGLVSEKYREQLYEKLQRTGRLEDFELDIVRKDGETRRVRQRIQPINVNGHEEILSLFFDVTEQRRAEEILRGRQE